MASSSTNELRLRSSPFIFKVPESVSRANPDAFFPRLFALGPQNANNKKMEFEKLYMAIKTRGELDFPEYNQLCSQITTLKLKIQACYDARFEIDSKNSFRIVLVDALFLLRLLLNISAKMENSVPKFDAQIHSLRIDPEMLLNDVIKLENQIPLVVLQEILPEPLKVKFPVLLYHLCQSLSPFALHSFKLSNAISVDVDPYAEISDLAAIVNESHHLLHFMYLSILIFPCMTRRTFILQSGFDDDGLLVLTFFQKWFSRLDMESALELIQNLMELKNLIQPLLQLKDMIKKQFFGHKITSSNVIPSTSHLHKLPVRFESTADGILATSFDKNQGHFFYSENPEIPCEYPPILFIPVININAFTETLFQNLLAFEAMANINPPVFALYLELMTALIRTPKDVQILKRKGIMTSHLESDEEVVKLFQRLMSSISNLKDPMITNLQPMTFGFERINKYEEKYKVMVEEINKYYDSFWRVKARRYRKKVLSFVWKMLGIIFIFFQILVYVKKLVISFIGNDEPNYDYVRTT